MRTLTTVPASHTALMAGFLAICAGPGGTDVAQAQVLAVNAPTVPSQGSGLLVRTEDECLLVVPKHVVYPGSREVSLADQRGRTFPGDVIHVDPQEDLALVRPRFPSQPQCNEWPRPEQVQAVLGGSRSGYLLYADASGAERRIEVDIVLPSRGTNVSVWPRDASLQFYKGMSGAGLFVDGTPVGILFEGPVASREGIASPLNLVWERIRPASMDIPSPWVRTEGMQLWVSRAVVVANACPTPTVQANWDEPHAITDMWCSGEWIVIDFEALLQRGTVRPNGYYCVRISNPEGQHRSFQAYPSWRARTYFSAGESLGVRVNDTDIVITERAYRSQFDDRCRFR